MGNRLISLEVRDGFITPFAAEVWVRGEVDQVTATTELRGRLMGPRCRFATTIEVAHPLQPFVKTPEGCAGLTRRVVLPEASLWDTQSPFLYQGAIELWQDGQLCERRPVSHGLRTLTLGPRSLIVNGRRLALRGRSVTALAEATALELRAAGVNLLLVPVTAMTEPLWDLADRIGFLLLGRITHGDTETTARVAALSAHASCLGWVMDTFESIRLPGGFLGVITDRVPHGPLPEGVKFLVGDVGLLDAGLPLLVHGAMAPDVPGIFGTFQ